MYPERPVWCRLAPAGTSWLTAPNTSLCLLQHVVFSLYVSGSPSSLSLFLSLFIYFEGGREPERERERERESQGGSTPSTQNPTRGLIPRTMRPRPEPPSSHKDTDQTGSRASTSSAKTLFLSEPTFAGTRAWDLNIRLWQRKSTQKKQRARTF